ncbi:hypothetical protein GCM10010260_73270 [Streptomyces filipinensis]|uniref:Lipoprotein n=1 Tax=Streptomyces filipinensis TaxID=66887 RepID=A0A918MFN9_9ACTN|nr:hypothetical protein [Streptomyces filipinensis]GGV22333.1 hypothetical protein GCM10010260_73270 [Streptomyces filipinensis]
MFDRRLRVMLGVAAVLLVTVTACGLDGPDPISGLKDDLRHIPQKTVPATRPHMVKQCTTGTARVAHSSTTGSGSHRRTRTWYTTERRQNCHKVRHGTETYRKEIRPERWCVRLDDVNGDHDRDNVWYRVDRRDYNRVQFARYHTRVKFVPASDKTYC